MITITEAARRYRDAVEERDQAKVALKVREEVVTMAADTLMAALAHEDGA